MHNMFHSEDIGRQNCREVAKSSKNVVLGFPICTEGDTPDFGNAFSNRTYFRHVAGFC